jgi:hypothetical protein
MIQPRLSTETSDKINFNFNGRKKKRDEAIPQTVTGNISEEIPFSLRLGKSAG